MKGRIGIYSGTFDPIHVGHISFAQKALEVCNLDQIILLPERVPWNKSNVSDYDTRVQLARDAIQSYPRLSITTLNSVPQTFKTVMSEIPHIFADNTVVLLVGSDVASNLSAWEGIDTFLEDHELCIGIRGEETEANVATSMVTLEEECGMKVKYQTVTTPHKNISSTSLR